MFGSTNLFGQTPFSTQSVFGQSTNASTNNPFAPKPFGSPFTANNPFGSQVGSPMFGGTSTGVFGQSQAPLAMTPTFGTSTSSAFGASTTPTFGSSIFGQKSTTFGGFGSTPAQSNPFGSTVQQSKVSQPSFGSTTFGSTNLFGGPSQPAFGSTSTPAFGATNTPAFGATTTPGFGSTGTAFGVSSTPAFGSSGAPAFGATSSSLFGSSSTPAFGAPSIPAFGTSSTPSFGFGSIPSFSAQSSPFGGQTASPAFGSPVLGQSTFGGQRPGSRAVPYAATLDTEGSSSTSAVGKIESISAMSAYKDKCHEELRWEDYQQGDKGGPNPAGQLATGIGFSAPAQTNSFGSTSTFGQMQAPASTFSSSGGLFGQTSSTFASSGFGSSSAPTFSSTFGSTTSNPFSASTAPLFGSTGSGVSTTPSFFSTSTPSIFGTSTPFGSPAAGGTTPAFGCGLTYGNTQSAGLFNSSPVTAQTSSIFGQQPTTGFGQTPSAFGSNMFGTQSTGFGGNMFSSSTSSLGSFGQSTSSLSTPFQTAATTKTPGAFSFGNVNVAQSQPVPSSSGFGGLSNAFSQTIFPQSDANNISVVVQPAPIANPFGSLPVMPQMSIGSVSHAALIQCGISSLPLSTKPTPIRFSSLLTARHLSWRRIGLSKRKFHQKNIDPRVPFFCVEEDVPIAPKADALFIPRENPRALIIQSIEKWPGRSGKIDTQPLPRNVLYTICENDRRSLSENNGHGGKQSSPSFPSKPTQKIVNGLHEEKTERVIEKTLLNTAGEVDIEAVVPKLCHPEYYTKPHVQELAAKERAEPGFCRHVRDFVVGRHGFGSIKFKGGTDVRRLDLNSIVQFYYREVIVYEDDKSNKPPIGQGLNKPAEVTLLNVKCVNKKSGEQYTEGPKFERYRELLKKKANEQGAKFISYDPIKGEWKFEVDHFSSYEFMEEEDDDDDVDVHLDVDLSISHV